MSAQRELFGLPIDALTMDDVVGICLEHVASRRQLLLGVVNAAKLVTAQGDVELRKSLLECDLILADGQSVVWASRLLGRPLPERVAGIDLFERLLAAADTASLKVYLLGATPDVVSAVEKRIHLDYPGVRIVGARDGYFTEAESFSVAEHIRLSRADMLFVGMSSPRKENFLRTWGHHLDVPVLHGVGGSFDIMAGVTRRAPEMWQRLGSEWLFRLLQEPRRLAGRYFTTNAAFLAMTAQELVKGRSHHVPALPEPPVERRAAVIDLRDRRTSDRQEPIAIGPRIATKRTRRTDPAMRSAERKRTRHAHDASSPTMRSVT